MKTFFYILVFFLPVIVFAQQSWYKSSPLDYTWKNVGSAGLSAGEAWFTSLAFNSSGQLYVAYMDYANAQKATVMKFDGTNWVIVGNAGFSAGDVWYTSLAFSPSDQPYVAYEDFDNSLKVTVMKFDGTNWVNVGNAGFSTDAAWNIRLAFSPTNGQPYVAYAEMINSNTATVKKFDGTNWVLVGTEHFSVGGANDLSLAFSQTGEPFVAYSGSGATVMKFDGINWVLVGNAGFSAGLVWYTNIAFNPINGQPYVSYVDGGNSTKITVMKFDGSNWINVGNAGFSAGWANYTSLAFNISGQPYVAFSDSSNSTDSWKATVMKFDGTNWVNVGNAGFSVGEVDFPSLVISSSGEPYVAFEDYGNSYKATVMKYDSALIGIDELYKSGLSIYPNPAIDKITIETSTVSSSSQLSILNLSGQQLIVNQIKKPKTQIDISNFPGGVYFVRLTGDRTVSMGKIIKQ